jgi:hypothetical protein
MCGCLKAHFFGHDFVDVLGPEARCFGVAFKAALLTFEKWPQGMGHAQGNAGAGASAKQCQRHIQQQ